MTLMIVGEISLFSHNVKTVLLHTKSNFTKSTVCVLNIFVDYKKYCIIKLFAPQAVIQIKSSGTFSWEMFF